MYKTHIHKVHKQLSSLSVTLKFHEGQAVIKEKKYLKSLLEGAITEWSRDICEKVQRVHMGC